MLGAELGFEHEGGDHEALGDVGGVDVYAEAVAWLQDRVGGDQAYIELRRLSRDERFTIGQSIRRRPRRWSRDSRLLS